MVNGNQIISSRPVLLRYDDTVRPEDPGGAHSSAIETPKVLWQRSCLVRPTRRVTSVMKARPRWTSSGAIAGSERLNDLST